MVETIPISQWAVWRFQESGLMTALLVSPWCLCFSSASWGFFLESCLSIWIWTIELRGSSKRFSLRAVINRTHTHNSSFSRVVLISRRKEISLHYRNAVKNSWNTNIAKVRYCIALMHFWCEFGCVPKWAKSKQLRCMTTGNSSRMCLQRKVQLENSSGSFMCKFWSLARIALPKRNQISYVSGIS